MIFIGLLQPPRAVAAPVRTEASVSRPVLVSYVFAAMDLAVKPALSKVIATYNYIFTKQKVNFNM